MKTVHIVGAGLFGQVIAARLREEHHDVIVWDRREPEAGSPPSGGHLKPSWLTAIPKEDLKASMETLDRLYGIQTLQCDFLFKKVELLRVDVDSVLQGGPVVECNVTGVDNGRLCVEGVTHFTGIVIVAAGAWSAELLPQLKHHLSVRKGMSVTFEGGDPMPNMIRQWAPFKQIVRTEHGPGKTWIGDGTAIKPENWNQERETTILNRLQPHIPSNFTKFEARRGLRPYMHNGLRQLGDRLWVATGGGKSGMALAGVYANRLAEE